MTSTDDSRAGQPPAPLVHFDFHGFETIKQIAHRAAILTNVSGRDILSDCRQRHLAYIRFGIVWAARQKNRPYAVIGRALSRDHSSIIYAERRANQLMVSNPEFARYCAALTA